MLREVRLYGHLGARFGRVHRLEVASAAEAVRALGANFPAFERYLHQHSEPGYRVLTGRRPVMELDELAMPRGGAIRIVPVVAGEKKGWGKIVAGAVLWTIGSLLPVNPLSVFLIKAGKLMIVAGIAELLTPQPRAQAPNERPENQPSYFFDGAVNTTAQGQPVPLLYGRLIVGSAVISSGLSAEEIAIAQPVAPPPADLPPDEQGKSDDLYGSPTGGGN